MATRKSNPPQESPTPEPVNAGKTYSDREHGFEFTYPDRYVATEPEGPEEPGILKRVLVLSRSDYDAWVVQHVDGDGPANALSIQAFSNPNDLSPLAWAKANNPSSNFVDGIHNEDYVTISFAGESAISYTRDGLWSFDVNVVKRRGMIIVTGVSYADKADPAHADFSQILSTFKFTE